MVVILVAKLRHIKTRGALPHSKFIILPGLPPLSQTLKVRCLTFYWLEESERCHSSFFSGCEQNVKPADSKTTTESVVHVRRSQRHAGNLNKKKHIIDGMNKPGGSQGLLYFNVNEASSTNLKHVKCRTSAPGGPGSIVWLFASCLASSCSSYKWTDLKFFAVFINHHT